jgi:TatD DNase family protein
VLIDSHCHLEFSDFQDDFDSVLKNAKDNKVEKMVTIGTRLTTFHSTFKIAAQFDDVYCTVGVHPSNVHEEQIASSEKLVSISSHSKVIGFGESGLDYHYMRTPKKDQITSFKNHIKAAQDTGLPLVVHTRDADEDTVNILKAAQNEKEFKCLIHCFTSSRWLAEECLKFGSYISISCIVTFKNATEIQEIVRDVIPIDRLLIETDAPYLAPTPHRGKRNEPAYVKHVAEFIADLKGLTFEEVASKTTDNFYRLFDKVKK